MGNLTTRLPCARISSLPALALKSRRLAGPSRSFQPKCTKKRRDVETKPGRKSPHRRGRTCRDAIYRVHLSMMSRRFAIIEPTYAFYSVETPGDEWYAAEALCLFSVLPSLRPGMKRDSHVGP